MLTIGTALRPGATRVMLLGAGELGKEVAIECQRLGLEVIAVDRYADAPAMHVAHRSHVINMLDGAALKQLVAQENRIISCRKSKLSPPICWLSWRRWANMLCLVQKPPV